MKALTLTLMTLLMTSAFADERDLTLPGAKWVGTFKSYVCQAFGAEVSLPSTYSTMNLKFEKVVTDRTLDNGLITASFEVDGKVCRYSAIMLADNDASTIELVNSLAYAVNNDVDCQSFATILDDALRSNDYLYYGHPHNMSIMMPLIGAQEVCGTGAVNVGLTFVVSGRL